MKKTKRYEFIEFIFRLIFCPIILIVFGVLALTSTAPKIAYLMFGVAGISVISAIFYLINTET